MGKKKVYLVQVNSVFGEGEKSAYIPYAVGCLASYACKSKIVTDNYDFAEFICLRERIDVAAAKIEQPYLVGFSSYVWNMEYNLALAEKIKGKYPDCIILFGGHNVSPDGSDLDKHPFIDMILHGEGERPFRALLTALALGKPLSRVHGISFRSGGTIKTTPPAADKTVSDFPSPYLEGRFDGIIDKNPDIKFSIIWETNRGCPNRCAFCDWGKLRSKLRLFPMKRLLAEIRWMADKHIEYVYCSDANFGILDRDSEITDLIIASKQEHGYPQKFKTNFTKSRDSFVLELGKKMYDADIGKSPTLSFQSLSPDVLKNIGRTNMDLDHFKRLMSLYNSRGIPVYSELILALPGETYDSFTDGVATLLECGQHKSIGIYPCELLANSLLGSSEYIEKFGINAKRILFSLYHCRPDENDIPEYSTTVISTDTMPTEDWERAYVFSITVQALHNLGLLRPLGITLHYKKRISYRIFYETFLSFFSDKSDTLCGDVISELRRFTHEIALGQHAFTAVFTGFGHITWGFEEYMFLRLVRELDRFYDEAFEFAEQYGLLRNLLEELFAYQKAVVKRPEFSKAVLDLNYDFYTFIENACGNTPSELEKRKNRMTVTDNLVCDDWDEYAKQALWYGRRVDRAILTSDKRNITVDYI